MISTKLSQDSFKTQGTFTISRGSRTEVNVLMVELSEAGLVGRGECVPYARYGESMESVAEEIGKILPMIEAGDCDRERLQGLLGSGAARNALDCAFWDLEAKKAGKAAWQMAGLSAFGPVTTAYTLSLESPEEMGKNAARNASRPLLKLKLSGPDDMKRVEAVRANSPDAKLIVDANEGWDLEDYRSLAPRLLDLGVAMVEQPMHADRDEALRGEPRPVALCADESCHDCESLPKLKGKYDMINIKLDKSGGLTEGLKLKAQAEAEGYQIMVGCMLASSLAMAPAVILAQGAEVVDLDGPLLLAEDREPALTFTGSEIAPPEAALWG